MINFMLWNYLVTFSIDVMFIIIKRATRRSVIFQRKLGLIKQEMNVMIRIIILKIFLER